jgi:hypothetical protein
MAYQVNDCDNSVFDLVIEDRKTEVADFIIKAIKV